MNATRAHAWKPAPRARPAPVTVEVPVMAHSDADVVNLLVRASVGWTLSPPGVDDVHAEWPGWRDAVRKAGHQV